MKEQKNQNNHLWMRRAYILLFMDIISVLVSYLAALLLRFDFVFSGIPRDVFTASGNGAELEGLYGRVEAEEVSGGTDIYAAAAEGLRQLAAYDLTRYTPAVILMTDGVSDGSPDDFRQVYEDLDADVPVFSIMFGSADPTQLESLAELTHARVFDGREDLIGAFRSVKGYN